MRKFTTITLLLMLAFGITGMLPGCGGDQAKAQEYMKKGDDLVKKLQADAATWGDEISSAITNMADPARSQSEANKARATGNALSKTAGEAKSEYEKIRGLKGVGDYVKYADFEIEALDLDLLLMNKAGEFLDIITALAASGDLAGIGTARQQFSQEADSLHKKILKLDEEAQKLRSDKEL